jgi:voltage-gated potassium channel Kch
MDNSRMILIVGGNRAGKSLVQKFINMISNNVEVVIIDKLPVPEETPDLNDFYMGDPPDWMLNEMKQKYKMNLPARDNSFRGGNRKKGGKTKYKRN